MTRFRWLLCWSQSIAAFLILGQIKAKPKETASATWGLKGYSHPLAGGVLSPAYHCPWISIPWELKEQRGPLLTATHLLLLLCCVGALPLQSLKGSNPPILFCCVLLSSFLGLFCILNFPNLKIALHKPLQRAGGGPGCSTYWKATMGARKQQYLGQTSATAFLLWRQSR